MKKIVFALAFSAVFGFSAELVEVYKSPSCGCCTKWGEIMAQNGFETKDYKSDDVIAVKNKFGVPLELASCHTALVGGYVVEGHVPPGEVKRLLELKPEAVGISVPGMPMESPGMEQGDVAEKYDVILFKKDGSREIFATYIGSKKLN